MTYIAPTSNKISFWSNSMDIHKMALAMKDVDGRADKTFKQFTETTHTEHKSHKYCARYCSAATN
jgi:hypothetical protein